LVAIGLGSWLNQRLSVERFQQWLSLLLILLGVVLWL
jgi:putative Ca2+/H+ antiporter (TMEM165/GDT1 family)